jgi:hypothetical protein
MVIETTKAPADCMRAEGETIAGLAGPSGDPAQPDARLDALKMAWMYDAWLAMGGYPEDFPDPVLATLTEPQKFQLVAQLNAARKHGAERPWPLAWYNLQA